MKEKIAVIVFLFLASGLVHAQDQIKIPSEQMDPLVGNWKIDLRPTPASYAYFQSFVVVNTEGNTFSGSFYGSEIKNAIINRNWNKIYFAFATSDLNNQYYHSGYIENNTLYGITYCPDREFTAPWTGVKE
jgi:hypothetical protein